MKPSKILVQLTGSIACYKTCYVISKLIQQGHEVYTVVTENAKEFIGLSTLEGLTRRPVYHNMWERRKALEHIELIRSVDLAIICPATANIINKLSAGIGDDPISTLFLAHDFKSPYLIAPAMNKNMYNHPATVKSLNILKEWGVKVLDTDNGYQACGDQGIGRLLEPDVIVEIINNHLENQL